MLIQNIIQAVTSLVFLSVTRFVLPSVRPLVIPSVRAIISYQRSWSWRWIMIFSINDQDKIWSNIVNKVFVCSSWALVIFQKKIILEVILKLVHKIMIWSPGPHFLVSDHDLQDFLFGGLILNLKIIKIISGSYSVGPYQIGAR